MPINNIKPLIDRIYELQSSMEDLVSGKSNWCDEKDTYEEVYLEVDRNISILRDTTFAESNPNVFRYIQDWRNQAFSMDSLLEKRVFIFDLYAPLLNELEKKLAHHYIDIQKAPKGLSCCVDAATLRKFVSQIDNIKTIMRKSISCSIEDVETTYQTKYRMISLQILIFQGIGIGMDNPNCFRSLWQFLEYRQSNLISGAEESNRCIDELYFSLIEPIQSTLSKHQFRDLSDDLIGDLKTKFSLNLDRINSNNDLGDNLRVNKSSLSIDADSSSSTQSVLSQSFSEISQGDIPHQESVSSINDAQRQRTQQQQNDFQREYDIYTEKINHLRSSLAIEAGAAVQFQLQKQIEQAENARCLVERKLEDIERQLQ
jgi:hypothetical protein